MDEPTCLHYFCSECAEKGKDNTHRNKLLVSRFTWTAQFETCAHFNTAQQAVADVLQKSARKLYRYSPWAKAEPPTIESLPLTFYSKSKKAKI
jgi:hypothetical protein